MHTSDGAEKPRDETDAQRFRALHEAFFVMPNPWDEATARILKGLGFKALASSSAALAWTLGKRDGVVRRSEAIAHAAMIANATGLPVNGDFESGYGDTPQEVADTISAAIDAGIAGCSIEDVAQDGPSALYDEATACRRLEAAREAIVASGADFVLTGRCEAILKRVPDAGAVVRQRLAAYAPFSDVLYAPGLKTEADVSEAVALTAKPLNIIAGLGGMSDDLGALERLGVIRISLGSNLAKATFGALIAAGKALSQGHVALDGAPGTAALEEALGLK